MGACCVIEPGQLWEDNDEGKWGLLVLERGEDIEDQVTWRMIVLWDIMEPQTVGTIELTRTSFIFEDFRRVL